MENKELLFKHFQQFIPVSEELKMELDKHLHFVEFKKGSFFDFLKERFPSK